MRNLTVERVVHTRTTNTRGYTNIYTPFGHNIRNELNEILSGTDWVYSCSNLYARNPPSRIIIASFQPFDPKIGITGLSTKGKLNDINELPDPLEKVKIEAI